MQSAPECNHSTRDLFRATMCSRASRKGWYNPEVLKEGRRRQGFEAFESEDERLRRLRRGARKWRRRLRHGGRRGEGLRRKGLHPHFRSLGSPLRPCELKGGFRPFSAKGIPKPPIRFFTFKAFEPLQPSKRRRKPPFVTEAHPSRMSPDPACLLQPSTGVLQVVWLLLWRCLWKSCSAAAGVHLLTMLVKWLFLLAN